MGLVLKNLFTKYFNLIFCSNKKDEIFMIRKNNFVMHITTDKKLNENQMT
jgi:hypothetical protein